MSLAISMSRELPGSYVVGLPSRIVLRANSICFRSAFKAEYRIAFSTLYKVIRLPGVCRGIRC